MKRRTFLEAIAISLLASRSVMAATAPEKYAAIRKLLKGKKIFLVPFSHTDWAWSNSRAWMVDRHAIVLEEALDLINTTPGFRFYVETWNEQMETFLARRPDRVKEMQAALNANQIAVCGATANQHPGWMETESMVRDFITGRRLFHEFAPQANLEVIVKPDVTPGSSQMPQILNKAGYRYFGVDRPDGGLTKSGLPRQFLWKGLDGSEIILVRDGGCGFIAGDSIIDDFTKQWPAAVERIYDREISKHLDKDNDRPVWISVGCDDARPLRHWQAVDKNGKFEESLMPFKELIAEWNKRETSTLQFGTPLDVFRAIDAQRSSLPVHNGIIDPTMWTYWYGLNGNEGLRTWRTKIDMALVSGETFWCSYTAATGDAYPQQEYATMWRDVLRAYSHAQMWLFTDDYQAALAIVKNTLGDAVALRRRCLDSWLGRMKIDERRQSVVIFNDLAWERTEVVELWAQMQHREATNLTVSDGDGKAVVFQANDVLWYEPKPGSTLRTIRELSMMALVTVPAFGYTTLYFDPAPGTLEIPDIRSGTGIIEDEKIAITLSENGIGSVLHKPSGKRYQETGNIVFNEIKDEGFYNYGPVTRTDTLTGVRVEKIQQGPVCTRFNYAGLVGKNRVHFDVIYYPHSSRLAFTTTIQNDGGNGHFMTITGLPAAGTLHADIHFGLEKRDVTSIAYSGLERMRKDVFWASHFTDWSDADAGISLIATTGEKGFQYFPEQNRLGHFLLMSIDPITETVRRFVTKAREGKGIHVFDYQFIFHSGDVHQSNMVRQDAAARHPLIPVIPNWIKPKADRTLPLSTGTISVSPANVQLSACYEDGGRRFFRVYESAGKETQASFSFPFTIKTAREVDFNGTPAERQISKNESGVKIDIKPWEIVTLEIG